MQIETEEEMLRANDPRRREVMVPERDVVSRPKRPVSGVDMKWAGVRPSPSSASYGRDADVISTRSYQSNKENISRPTKLRVRADAVYCTMQTMLALCHFCTCFCLL